ncbi:hypothetical protein DFQ15_103193 [Xylophilus ampelinus]|uniref:Uncharacterized protein n=1 Tax=Xylophilus ampelinus TaxID=54067 RepID=A0A318SJX0_9BURK|nr:hypothetical protein DFQ15_103193 [Xylophilus ampelinus]
MERKVPLAGARIRGEARDGRTPGEGRPPKPLRQRLRSSDWTIVCRV